MVRARLTAGGSNAPFAGFNDIFAERKAEADEFYEHLQRGIADEEARMVQRQALAGMIWSKQFFYYDIPQWLNGDPARTTASREPQARPQF